MTKEEVHDAPSLGDMDPEAFRVWGKKVVDWIADYLANPERYPVLPDVKPGDIRRRLPGVPPENPEPMSEIVKDVERVVAPGLTHWNHPCFMAYFASSASAPGILGEMFCSAFNVNAMLWRSSPAATELEELALDWFRQMIGLPAGFDGVIYDGASVSTMHAVAAAREVAPGLNSRELGLCGRSDAPRLRLYTSEQAHSSVEKAAITLGIGQAGVRKISVDSEFRMRPEALEQAIVADQQAGWMPFCAVATVGTTSTTSVDPIPAIAEICQRHGVWLHVDAAYGGSAAILPEMRWIFESCDRADSLVVNPHKWLFTPLDLSILYSPRIKILKQAFSLVPDYLQTTEVARNFMDYGVPLGRRFRALKLWMVIRSFGRRGLEARIREHIRLARLLAGWIESDPDFELGAPVKFSTVCFRAVPKAGEEADAINQKLVDAVHQTREFFISTTRLNGRLTLRMAINNLRTEQRHIERAWALIKEKLAELRRL